ncbi:MAG: DUF4167 domain-containing protein [Pseudomonadota bacterium]|nr:DUF4167 domain-containing protein [Pseudomonadota bacterium]
MRHFKGMKRQRGRSRNNSGGNSSGKPQHNTNRAFDSNGPDGMKVRGAAQHVYEKYQQLERDAHTAGDRVLAENHLQHAEHYFRVMRVMQPQRPLAEIIGRDQFVSGYDMDFEDESGSADTAEPEAGSINGGESGGERPERGDNRRDERPRDDYRQADQRPRDDRTRNDAPRNERWTSERPQNDRGTSDRFNDRSKNGPVADDRSTRSAPDDRIAGGRDERYRLDRPPHSQVGPLTVVEPEATPLVVEPDPASAHVLRADDGEVNHAPAFLQVRPSEPRAEAAESSRAPRRRRPSRPFEAADPEPPADPTEGS